MTKKKWLFIGTDQRLSECNRLMIDRGYECRYIKTNTYTQELEALLIEFVPENIVFPILEMDGSVPLELIGIGATLYTGVTSDKWIEAYKAADIRAESYLREELFIWENARITAEAFILAYYAELGHTIAEKRFNVAGYGRVGKMVADTLASLGGDVTVIARSVEQLSEAEMRGFKVEQLSENMKIEDSYLVNTIPTRWFSVQQALPRFIFDLASAPGCLVKGLTLEYYRLLPGLPGNYFPVDAAISLADALERIHQR